MSNLIGTIFDVAATLFDKIPFLSALRGYRSVLGFIGLAVVTVLQAKGIGTPDLISNLHLGFMAFTGLALNAKGR